MDVEVVTDDNYSSAVLNDLGRRRGSIQNITTRSNNRVLQYCCYYFVYYLLQLDLFVLLGCKGISSSCRFIRLLKGS